MLKLVKPRFEELLFRQELLADEATMTYNAKWGGTIAFSPDRWQAWYAAWVAHPDRRFYRYLYDEAREAFVGEVAYHFDEALQCYLCDVIVKHCYRGNGFGTAGLELLLNVARENGITTIYDNIALDNAAIALFQRQGFREIWRNEAFIMLEKQL